MRFSSRCLVASLLLAPILGHATSPATPEIMEKIYAEYWDESSAQNPMEATFNGDNRFNDQFGPTTSAQEKAQLRALAGKYLARLAAYDPAALPSEDRISYDLLRYNLQQSLESLAFPDE